MMNYEGNKGELLIKEAVYRIDPQSGKLTLVTDELHKPNGLCFSPDYKKLYIADTGRRCRRSRSKSGTWSTGVPARAGTAVRFDGAAGNETCGILVHFP
jgi:sugar lactone lactonase YvrE